MRDLIDFIKLCFKWCFFGSIGLSILFKIFDPGTIHYHHDDAVASEPARISTRELAEHFNACVQSYTRTAHPIALDAAEKICSCAGDYLSTHGYGDASFRDAQKACGMETVSR